MMNILIADDNEFIVQTVSSILRNAGYDTLLTAQNGCEIISTIKSEKIDLIITDVAMPEMDAIELLKYFKSQDIKIPLVLISGEDPKMLDMIARLGERYDAKILDVFKKPIQADALIALLQSFSQNNAA